MKKINIIIIACMMFLINGCATKVETVYVYKSLHCEDAVKPELQELDTNQYIASKANTAILLSNFSALNLYIERLQQQIECYKSQSNCTETQPDEESEVKTDEALSNP